MAFWIMVGFFTIAMSEFVPIQYERTKADQYPDNILWILQNTREDFLYPGLPSRVSLITEDYYDTFIMDRWTNTWLAGNTTWVIAVTSNITKDIHYSWTLLARSIHILNDHYFQHNDTIRFGLIDSRIDELLKETLGGREP
jgi:hypothetical protein